MTDVKPTKGCPYRSKTFTGESGELLKVSLYETPKDKFRMHARNAMGIIFTYDVTDPASLNYLRELLAEYKETRHRENCLLFVLGNKVDRQDDRAVSDSDVKEVFDGVNA
jgi:GTPase SAR1 family protein